MAKYTMLSPDGFSIEFNKTYTSEKEAEKAFAEWKKAMKDKAITAASLSAEFR